MKCVTKIIFALLGLVFLVIGLYMLNIYESGNTRYLFSFLFGIGCTMFGVNLGHLIELAVMKVKSDEVEKVKIQQQDERNIFIKNCAKGYTFNLMGYVFMTVILIFFINNISNKVIFTKYIKKKYSIVS